MMIECMADHCAICHGFANVIADICDEFPELVFLQINKKSLLTRQNDLVCSAGA